MGIATPTPPSSSQLVQPFLLLHQKPKSADLVAITRSSSPPKSSSCWNSMSQGFHSQGVFGFSDDFERSNQANRRDQGMRSMQGLIPGEPSAAPLSPIEQPEDPSSMYVPTGPTSMLSDMFSFQQLPPSATDLLASQISLAGYRHDVPGLNPDTMHLYLMSPSSQHERAPQPQPQPQSQSQGGLQHGFHMPNYGGGGGGVEGQGLSLSLSSSLQQMEMASKAEELRSVREGMLFYNTNTANTSSQHQQQPMQQFQGQQSQQLVHVGYGSGGGGPMGVVNVLRHSKYARAAQELLEEFCSVGRGQSKGSRRNPNPNPNPNNPSSSHAGGAASTSAASKDPSVVPALSPSDKFEHQRRKAKLLFMLDEVDRRYNHYCDQMQMVVNSFDSVMGFGAATPYTSLAQKAMSRHFRCLKDAIAAQLKRTCELLGEKDGAGGTGITKGETPRLKLLEQSLRQQRAFHQMGMMEQEAWRPQRGLPENSVNILRAWLFEHFLHPYPSDADKHLLARKTGLSRNQVTNWFINARVRLWKPMVEEMYQQEAKEEEERERGEPSNQISQSPTSQSQRSEPNPDDQTDPSHAPYPTPTTFANQSSTIGFSDPDPLCMGSVDGAMVAGMITPATHMRFGTSGDVSLTLGLRQTGNLPENNRFSLRDFNGGG